MCQHRGIPGTPHQVCVCPLARRYGQCLELALEACQDTPEQFKLVETPLKSFLLVSNILPQDNRPWHEARSSGRVAEDDYDFSSLALELLPLRAEDTLVLNSVKASESSRLGGGSRRSNVSRSSGSRHIWTWTGV